MRLSFILILIHFFITKSLFADQVPRVVLNNDLQVLGAEGKIGSYVDESLFMSINQLKIKESDPLFKVNRDKQLNFGYSSAAIWCKLNLKNESKTQWFLKLDYPIIDYLDIYLVDQNRNVIKTIQSGSIRNNKQSTYCLSGFMFQLPMSEGGEYSIFIKIYSKNIIIPMIEIGNREYFYTQELPEIFLSGAFYGLLLGLILYSMFLLFFKQTNYAIFYSLYLIFFGLFDLLLNGYLLNFLENLPRVGLNYWVLFSLSAVQFCLIFFIKNFIDPRFLSKTDRLLLKIPIWGIAFLTLTCWFIDFKILIGLAWFFGFLFPHTLGFYLIFKSFKEGFFPAKFFVWGYFILLVGLFLFILSVSGYIHYSKLITHITHIAIAFQALLFGVSIYSKQHWTNPNQTVARLEVIKQVRENQNLQSELTKQQKKLYGAVLQAQERERTRIAKDLHDGVGQTLAAVKMMFSQIIYSNPSVQNPSSQNGLELLDDACTEIRNISHQMMPINLIKFGLKSGLEDLYNKTFKGSKIDLDYNFTGLNERHSQDIEIGVYRILQEIISNMIKHSGCTKAFIDIIETGDRLMVIAEDNGKGFDYKEDGGFGAGLDNIKFRANALSAKLVVETRPTKGCVYQINIPLNHK